LLALPAAVARLSLACGIPSNENRAEVRFIGSQASTAPTIWSTGGLDRKMGRLRSTRKEVMRLTRFKQRALALEGLGAKSQVRKTVVRILLHARRCQLYLPGFDQTHHIPHAVMALQPLGFLSIRQLI
jgi:hypothetical protein